MKRTLAAVIALFLSAGKPGTAHRLDEYLQATIITLDRSRIQCEVRLTPGVAIFPMVLAALDSNGDGVISEVEQHVYAERVLRDLSLNSDGERLTPRLVEAKFPTTDEMKEGRGEIQFSFDTNLRSTGSHRSLTFENHHMSRISAYLVNSLVPSDPGIRITMQDRNASQSVYHVDYEVAGTGSNPGAWGCLGGMALVLFARVAFLRRRTTVHALSDSAAN